MPLFYPQGNHSHEFVIHLFCLYFSTFPRNMCNHVQYVILGLCFKIYINGIIVFVSFCNTIFSHYNVISDLSVLVSMLLLISFNCCLLASRVKYHLFINGFCHQKINSIISFHIYLRGNTCSKAIWRYSRHPLGYGYFFQSFDWYFLCMNFPHL